jgi:hypothetical protein
MGDIYTTDRKPYPHFGYTAYRIEVDASVPQRPLQRHIWTRADGTEEAEAWILSPGTKVERLIADGFTPIADAT